MEKTARVLLVLNKFLAFRSFLPDLGKLKGASQGCVTYEAWKEGCSMLV